MLGSNLLSALTLAIEALVLVERGSSERSAVAFALVADPSLREGRKDALDLVLGTVTRLDIVDQCVQVALTKKSLSRRELALSRLAAHILQGNSEHPRESVIKALRTISPTSFRPRFEYLLGVLLMIDPDHVSNGETDLDRLALRTHNPRWWVDYCFRVFGRSEAIRLLEAAPRQRYVRVNSLRNKGRTSLPSSLQNTEKLGRVESIAEVFVLLGGEASILAPFYSEGLFQAQDLASFFAVKAAEPSPGEKVLDLCASPGAKTSAMAQLMKNRGRILSVDYSISRMKTWRREMSRLGVIIAEPIIEDASRPGIVGRFDLVLIDPPCSGTGVLDRNPRMKWRLSQELVDKYSNLQHRILSESSNLIAPGGRILYCTCSLTLEENEKVVSSFLDHNQDFETKPVLDGFGSPGLLGMKDCRRFYPHRDRTAGYFVSRLERSG